MKRIIFKTVSLIIIFTYICNLCLHDLSFAEEATSSSDSTTTTSSTTDSTSSSSESSSNANNQPAPAALTATNSETDYRQYSGPAGFNLSVLQSFQTDIFTGQATFSIPIATPPGRKGIQPNISLNYSSGSGNGILGLGWSLELGYIERSTKKGVPKYDSTDTFVFNSGGSNSELVSIGSSEYRTKIEGGFSKFYFDGISWIVTDKSGTKYYFGSSSASRQDGNTSYTLKWCLDKVLDKQGNYLSLSYLKDQGQIYPDKISYTGNEITAHSPLFTVEFGYETRSDLPINYRNGKFKVSTAWKLSDIRVKANTQLIRHYRLIYNTNSSYTKRSLLTTIRQSGSDDTTYLPDINFNYQSPQVGWELASDWSIPSEAKFSSPGLTPDGERIYEYGVRIVDVNSDGFQDIPKFIGSSGPDYQTYLNNKTKSFIYSQPNWLLPDNLTFVKFATGTDTGFFRKYSVNQDQGVRFVDINADGWVDVVRYFRFASGTVENKVYLNNKSSGWIEDPSWKLPNAEPNLEIVQEEIDGSYINNKYTGVILEDINGDGLVDYIKAQGSGGTANAVYLNDGKGGWQKSLGLPGDVQFNLGATLTELNGDGLPDIFVADYNQRFAYLNTGSGWQTDPLYNMDNTGIRIDDGSSQFVDVNADGLADAVLAKDNLRATYMNIWHTMETVPNAQWQLPDVDANLTKLGTRFLDANADGLIDFIIHYAGQVPKLYLNKAKSYPDLLNGISNGLGGAITITYKPSTQFDNTGGDGISDLPFPVHTVNSTTSQDAQGNAYVTTYEYKNGAFDFTEREFRGFGYVKTTDAEGNYTESYFKQDNIFKGRLSKQETKDKSGNLYAKTENIWANTEAYPGVNFPYLSQTDNYTYDGDTSYKQTQVKYEYDAYGNPTKVISEGEVGVTGDEKTQGTEYAYNTADWLVGFPKHTYLQDNLAKTVSEKWFYYDNATSVDTQPSKGLLTKEETPIFNATNATNSTNAITQYAYDSYGNLTKVTDALSRTTSTEYDTLTQSYPIKVTNALGHTVQTVYYGINEPTNDTIRGFGLVGQVKSTKDPNSQRTYNIYDTLGRLTKAIGPLDTETNPGVSYAYNLPQNTNLSTLLNPSFESWSGGLNQAPDYWELWSIDNAATNTVAATTTEKVAGNFAVVINTTSSDVRFNITEAHKANLISAIGPGKSTVTFYAWVKASLTNQVRLCALDSWSNTAYSNYHSGSGEWELLKVVNSNLWTDSGGVNFIVKVESPGQVFVDEMSLYKGSIEVLKISKKVKADYAATPNYLSSYSFYDGLGRVMQTKSPAEDDPVTNTKRQIISDIVKFDSRGQVKEKFFPYFVNDSSNYETPTYSTSKTSFTYDPVGRLIQTTNPDLTYSTVSYSDWVTTATDENGHYKTSYSDAYGKIIKIEEHNSTSTYITTYTYDTLGNLTKVTDNQNNITQIWYDSLGRKLKMDDPDMGVWTYDYDLLGNLTKQTDAKLQVLTFTYDKLNRLTQKQGLSPQGTVPVVLATYYYDTGTNGIGRLSKVTDLSSQTEFFYDTLGRETKSIKTVDGAGYTVERIYDALDRLITLKYPDAETVTYTYNPQGIEKVEGLSPTGTVPYVNNIDYSPTGQITKIKYGNGTETNYTYDQNTLRLTNLIAKDSSSAEIQNLKYDFDNVGNIKSITDSVTISSTHPSSASQTFLYDDLDRLIQAAGTYGTLTYAYDSIGNMTSKEGVTLTYGKSGKLPHAVTQYGSTAIDYDANGNMISKKGLSPQGTVPDSQFIYDVENRLVNVEDRSPPKSISPPLLLKPGWNFISLPFIPADPKISSVLSSISGKFDQVSRYNATTKKFENYVGNSKYDEFSTFDYGLGYQIYITSNLDVSLTLSGTEPTTDQNINLKKGSNLIFSPNLTSTDVETALSPLKLGVDYDKVYYYNKSLAKFQEYSSAKKEFSQLNPGESYYLNALKDTTWTIKAPPPKKTDATYDGDGGRVKKKEAKGTTTYIGSLFEKLPSSNTVKHIYMGSNRICAVESNGSYYYYHTDHLGSSNIITDKTGKQTSLNEYTPFGKAHKHTGTVDPKYKFTGKELDSDAGLYFYGARYYDPELGRFISADPTIQRPYDPQDLNRYAYARNNPINLIDPSGLGWKKFWKKFGSSVLSIVGIVAAPFTGGASLYLTWAGLAWSGVNAAQAGQFGAFAAGLGAGLLTAGLASAFVAPAMAGFMGAGEALTAFQGAVITATEFGLAGAAAGFAGTLAGGGSLGQAGIAAGIGFGAGAVMGGAIGYTYAAGMQDVLHGFDTRGYNNTLQQYQKLYGNLSSAEKTFVRQHPIASAKIMQESVKSLRFATQGAISGSIGGGIEGIHNGPADAVRHALWSGSSARRVGLPLAKQFTSLHELSSTRVLEVQMDTFNNNVGFALATDVSKGKTAMENLVMDAYRDGRLQTGLGQ